MRWARVAVVLGPLLLVIGFCAGVETPGSTTVAGHSYACDDVLPASMLVAGAGGHSDAGHTERALPGEEGLQARVDAGCAPIERVATVAVWGGLVLGALVLLVGWTALREEKGAVEGRARFTAVPR